MLSSGRARTRRRLFMTDGIGGGGGTPLLGPCGSPYGSGKATLFNGTSQYGVKTSPVGVINATGGHWAGAWAMFIGSVPNTGRSVILANGDMNTFNTDTNWAVYWNGAAGQWQATRISNTGAIVTCVKAATPAINTWYFVEWWWDGNVTIFVNVDRGTAGSNAVAGTNATFARPLTLGANGLFGNLWGGRIDAGFYANINPTSVAGLQDAVYNAGAGVTLAGLTVAQQANFTSWWELGEIDAATLACDFKGSNHLTRTGGPTQAAGKT